MFQSKRIATVGILAAAMGIGLVAGTASASKIAYYNFNDATVPAGTYAGEGLFADTSGFASPSPMTIQNYTGAMRTPDPWGGQALTFNGSQQGYVDYPHNVYKLYRMGTDTNFDGTSQGAIEFWYKRDVGSNPGGFMEFYDNGGYDYKNAELGIFNNSYFPQYIGINTSDSVNANTNYSPDNTIKYGAWTQVVMTWDGSNQYLYQNGALLATGTQVGPLLTDSTVYENFYFASVPGLGGNFIGSMDELSMYDNALSAADVLQHYQAGLAAMPEPGSLALVSLGAIALMGKRRRVG